jgi:hypothetical protein
LTLGDDDEDGQETIELICKSSNLLSHLRSEKSEHARSSCVIWSRSVGGKGFEGDSRCDENEQVEISAVAEGIY